MDENTYHEDTVIFDQEIENPIFKHDLDRLKFEIGLLEKRIALNNYWLEKNQITAENSSYIKGRIEILKEWKKTLEINRDAIISVVREGK